jgi:hypothetical protein
MNGRSEIGRYRSVVFECSGRIEWLSGKLIGIKLALFFSDACFFESHLPGY